MSDLLAHLRREADLTLAALDGADWDAPVAACPGWALRDLVRHTGGIHRWAQTRALGTDREPRRELGDTDLRDWYAEGAARLHEALSDADPDAPCDGFEDRVTVAFWVRRQAHETAVHRVDAELAAGRAVSPVDDEAALDGVAEVVEVFAPRQVRLGRSQPPPRGAVLQAPSGAVQLPGPDPIAVSGQPGDLLLALWRRPASVRPSDPLAWRAVLASGLTP